MTDAAPIAWTRRIGADPLDHAAVMSHESGGTFSTSIRGGGRNRNVGLIRFGIPKQQKYGTRQDQSF